MNVVIKIKERNNIKSHEASEWRDFLEINDTKLCTWWPSENTIGVYRFILIFTCVYGQNNEKIGTYN